MPAKKASGWVDDNIAKRPKDKAIANYLPARTKQLLGDARASLDDSISSRGAVGLTKHGENGPIINWREGDLSVALHEIGHALQYPGRRAGNKFITSVVNPVDAETIVNAALKEYKLLKNAATEDFRGVLWLNATDTKNEMWADIVSAYLNPRRTLMLRESMPKTWETLNGVLGELPSGEIKLSSKLSNFLKQVGSEGHLRRRQWEAIGLNDDTYDQLADIIIPKLSPGIIGARKYAKNEMKNLKKRVAAAEAILGG